MPPLVCLARWLLEFGVLCGGVVLHTTASDACLRWSEKTDGWSQGKGCVCLQGLRVLALLFVSINTPNPEAKVGSAFLFVAS